MCGSNNNKDATRGSTDMATSSSTLVSPTSPKSHDENDDRLLDTSGHSEEISVIDDSYDDNTLPNRRRQSSSPIPRSHGYEDSSSCESSPSSSPHSVPMLTPRPGLLHVMAGPHMMPGPMAGMQSNAAAAALSIPSMPLHDRLAGVNYPHN